MTRLFPVITTVLALGTPAMADADLARILGVAPGQYTDTELMQVQRALENDDVITARFILSGEARGAAPVPAGRLFALEMAEQDNDAIRASFLRGSGSGEVISSQGLTPRAAHALTRPETRLQGAAAAGQLLMSY